MNKYQKELKRCPFCGGNAKLHKTEINFSKEEYVYYVRCENCKARADYSFDENNAIGKWNKRVN